MPTYFCKKTATDIIINGNLNKPEWAEPEAINLVENISKGQPRQYTYAKMMWTNEFLYVAFQCQDDFINASYKGFNDRLYDEEVVEIFIDDNRDLKTYIEVEANPLNAVLHYSIHNNLQGKILQFARTVNNVKSAVFYDQAQGILNIEIAIPLAEFVTAAHIPPQPGDKWLVNLYRIDRPKDGHAEYSAWSPTGKINFHLPEFFGELVFID